jgi:hypothetical protein
MCDGGEAAKRRSGGDVYGGSLLCDNRRISGGKTLFVYKDYDLLFSKPVSVASLLQQNFLLTLTIFSFQYTDSARSVYAALYILRCFICLHNTDDSCAGFTLIICAIFLRHFVTHFHRDKRIRTAVNIIVHCSRRGICFSA